MKKEASAKASIISLNTPKGGVGKTTMTYHIAMALAAAGHRTLLIDMDSQGSASNWLSRGLAIPLEHNIINLFTNKSIIPMTVAENLWLIGSDISLSDHESLSDPAKVFKLRHFLNSFSQEGKALKTYFDYVLIDTPPNVGLFSYNALIAADYVIAVCDPSLDAYKGLRVLNATLQQIITNNMSSVQLLGIIINAFDPRLNADSETFESIKDEYPDALLSPFIHRTTLMRKARMAYKSINDFPDGKRHWEGIQDLVKNIKAKIN